MTSNSAGSDMGYGEHLGYDDVYDSDDNNVVNDDTPNYIPETDQERDFEEERANAETMRIEASDASGVYETDVVSPYPTDFKMTLNSLYGKRRYDDYDANSAENEPTPGFRYMVSLVGMGSDIGCIIKADIVITALHDEHANFIAGAMLVYLGMNGGTNSGTIDSVTRLTD